VQQEKKLEPKISPNEGGKAIMNLGNFLQKKDWHDDAMYFFRHALYIFLFEVDVIKPMLLNEEEYCDGLFYDEISADGLKVISQTHELLGAILIKMGDVHGKNLEVNDALRAYRAAQVFWNVYLRNHKVSNQEGNEEDDEDLNELTDYAASIEGLALSHNRIGGVYTSKGDLQAALNSFHEALSLQIDALGDDHLEVAKTLHNIGVCHRHNDEWDEALEYYKKAHFIFETNVGKCHLDTARTMHNIGGVYRRKKMYPEAMKCFVEVLRVRRKILGDDHPSVSIALVSIAAVLRRSGRKEEANKFYAAAVR
jgi:tetratricopeptide (TPR) repeat protein